MRLGFVSIDTSHPESWLPIERDFGCEVVGFWDGGEIHPPEVAAEFSRRTGVRRFETLKDLVPEVDAVILHSCNWDRHVEQAEPFLQAGKAVFIDKPMAGNAKDLEILLRWERGGARLTGGSCFLLCEEIEKWKAERGKTRPHTVFAGLAVDDFNYGIHAYSLAAAIYGPGLRRVRTLGRHIQQRVQLEWEGGEVALLSLGTQEGWLPAHVTIVTESSVLQMQPATSRLYDGYVRASLAYLFGQVEEAPVRMEALVECELAALAALRSGLEENRWVEIGEARGAGPAHDGAAFAYSYRKLKYPGLAPDVQNRN